MITNKRTSKRILVGRYTVESGDISGYAADEMRIPIDDATIAHPTEPSGKDFIGEVSVRDSNNLLKTGFKKLYMTSGTLAGYLRVIESTSTFAAGDVVTVWGTLTFLDD